MHGMLPKAKLLSTLQPLHEGQDNRTNAFTGLDSPITRARWLPQLTTSPNIDSAARSVGRAEVKDGEPRATASFATAPAFVGEECKVLARVHCIGLAWAPK